MPKYMVRREYSTFCEHEIEAESEDKAIELSNSYLPSTEELEEWRSQKLDNMSEEDIYAELLESDEEVSARSL